MKTAFANNIISSLGTVEATLQAVITNALAEREYVLAAMTTEAAGAVRRIRDSLFETGGTNIRMWDPHLPGVSSANGKSKGTRGAARSGPPKPMTPIQRRATNRVLYPRFEVKRAVLEKIAWSKRDKSEYTHRVPRAIFDRTIRAMAHLQETGAGLIMAEAIRQDTEDRDEAVPAYRIYVILNFLLQRGCVAQQGREGYDIPKDIVTRAEKAWADLPAKSSPPVQPVPSNTAPPAVA